VPMLACTTYMRKHCKPNLDARTTLQYSCAQHAVLMMATTPPQIPFAAQAVPFQEYLQSGKIPEGLITSEYIGQQFVERLVHYVLSVPAGSYTMAQLSQLLEQLDGRNQVFFFKRLKETSPESLKDFAPLYYGFMNEYHALLFT
jgi:hypothetical protein